MVLKHVVLDHLSDTELRQQGGVSCMRFKKEVPKLLTFRGNFMVNQSSLLLLYQVLAIVVCSGHPFTIAP